MWRPFVCESVTSRVFRVLAAQPCAQPAAEQKRWNSNTRMTKGLRKMVDRHGGTKKKFYLGSVSITNIEDRELRPARKRAPYSEGQKRRAHQIGRVLYNNITQLVNSGELSPQLSDMAVEIVRVKIVPDFSSVNVYWLTSGSAGDDVIDKLLNEHAGLLRQQLTARYLLGTVPRINFVRDESRARYMEVEAILKTADFGPGFVPMRMDTPVRDIVLSESVRTETEADEEVDEAEQLQAQFDQIRVAERGDDQIRVAERGDDQIRVAERGDDQICVAERGDDQIRVAERGDRAGFATNRVSADTSRGNVPRVFMGTDGESGDGRIPDGGENNQSGRDAERDVTVASKESVSPSGHKQTGPSAVVSPQPSSLEVGQLSDQYLSEVPTATNTHNVKQLKSMTSPAEDSVYKGFRDDMYGLPHTDILNKILIRKQKAGTRPTDLMREKHADAVLQEFEVNSLKKMLQRKKVKVKALPQSDYLKADITGLDRSDHHQADDESFFDEEIEEVDITQPDDDPFRKK